MQWPFREKKLFLYFFNVENGHKKLRNKQRKTPILCNLSPNFISSVTNCVLLSIDIQGFKTHWWQWQMFLNFYFLNLKIFVSRRTWSLDREGIHATEVLVVSILLKQLHDRLVWYIAKMLQYQNRSSNVTWLCIISVCAFRLRPFDVINVRWRAFVVEVARRKDSLRSISFSI